MTLQENRRDMAKKAANKMAKAVTNAVTKPKPTTIYVGVAIAAVLAIAAFFWFNRGKKDQTPDYQTAPGGTGAAPVGAGLEPKNHPKAGTKLPGGQYEYVPAAPAI